VNIRLVGVSNPPIAAKLAAWECPDPCPPAPRALLLRDRGHWVARRRPFVCPTVRAI